MQLRPVTFTFKPEMNMGTTTQVGFIAEEVNLVIPELVSFDEEGLPSGVNYPNIGVLLTEALQEVNLSLETIASTTASSTPKSRSFASSFFSNLFTRLTSWFADATNGVGDFFANRVRTKELCVGDGSGAETCITKSQLDSLLAGAAASQGGGGGGAPSTPPPAPEPDLSPEPMPDTEAPVVTLNGTSPTTITVGDTYADMGATATDNVDTELYMYVSVDGGAPMLSGYLVTVDTSVAGTHTIVFTVTDAAGNTGTASRTVDVVAPAPAPAPEPAPEPTPEPVPTQEPSPSEPATTP